jgi:hypothetical protein
VAQEAAGQLSRARRDAAEARAALERLQAQKGSSAAVSNLAAQLRGARDAARAAVQAQREAERRLEELEAQAAPCGCQKQQRGRVVTVSVEACCE